MGCASSAQNEDKAGNERPGGAKSAADEPAAPKQNPYMTLTNKEIFQLKMSWKGIRRSLEDTGVTMFIFMFEACPETKECLEKFKNTPNETLRTNDPFINYCTNLMEQFDTAITELDDADKTHAKLQKIGTQYKTDKMPESIIKEMRQPFLKAVEQTLGDRYSDRMRIIYEVFVDYLIKAMLEGYTK